ncbi:MAG: hypothetical protein P0S95_00105 [Rhabdochlamydiaceae bacterium]|nr:hypothetical protein [Candidatus Amphrikana amoebophyrae]
MRILLILPLVFISALLFSGEEPILKTDFLERSGQFFSQSKVLTPADYSQKCHQELDMTWNSKNGDQFHWIRNKNGVLLEIVYFDQLPSILPSQFHSRFKKQTRQSKECYVCTIIDTLDSNEQPIPEDYQYLLAEPRIFEIPQDCTNIDFEQFAQLVANKNVIFYTGAGISAGRVPAMEGLSRMFFLEEGMSFDQWISIILKKESQLLHDRIEQFFLACFTNPPSVAHNSLKQIVFDKKSPLFTENLDHLHEKSGVLPNRIHPHLIKTDKNIEEMKKYDLLVCIGLSHDDRGFLAWYKHHCPEGKIVSLDLKQPNYLGAEDYFLKGDLQTLIPNLAETL